MSGLADALTFIEGQFSPLYRPVAGASVTPDAAYTESALVMSGTFTPPTGTTSTPNRIQVTSPAVSALLPTAAPYMGVIAGTVAGCTPGSVATKVDAAVSQLLADRIAWNGTATSFATTPPSNITGPGGVFFSPYNVYNDSGVMELVSAGAYAKLRFDGTSLGVVVDLTKLQAATTASVDYPWYRYKIDGGSWVRGQVPTSGSSSTTISLATGLTNTAGHTCEFHFEHLGWAVEAWTNPNGGLRIASWTTDGVAVYGPATIKPRRFLIVGDSMAEGFDVDAAADQVTAPHDHATDSFATIGAAAMHAEYGLVAYAGQGYKDLGDRNMPIISTSFGSYWSGKSRLVSGLFSPAPDVIVMNHGGNDGDPGTIDSVVVANVQTTMESMRTAAPSAKIVVLQSFHLQATASIALGFQNYVTAHPTDTNVSLQDARTAAAIFNSDPTNLSDGTHPTVAGHLLLAPIFEYYVRAGAGYTSGYQLAAYLHADTYFPQNLTVPIDETGTWYFDNPNYAGEWRFRVIKVSDGSQQGSEWATATKTWLASGVRIEAFLHTDTYYSQQQPDTAIERQWTDVLIDPGATSIAHFSLDSRGFLGEWRFRLVDATTGLPVAPEWQGINGNHDTYDGIELRFCQVTDRDYESTKQVASTANIWWWNHVPMRRAVRIHLITDDDGLITALPAPQAEWTMTGGLQRSSNYTISDVGYGTRSEGVAFIYDAAVCLCVFVCTGQWALAQQVALGIVATQFDDGPFPFAVQQRYFFAYDRYIRVGGGVAFPAYALGLFKQHAPTVYQDARIDRAILKAVDYMKSITDATGTVRGGEGIYQPQWLASTSYPAVGARSMNGNKIYEVVMAGTSASSGGPTGTGSSITDGSVVWKWIVSSDLDPIAITYHATEHNLNAWRAINLAYLLFGRSDDLRAANAIRRQMLTVHWNEAGGYFYQSTDITGTPDGDSTLDSSSWGASLLLAWGETDKALRAIAHIDAAGYPVTFSGHTGYRTFSATDGIPGYSALWHEGTAGVVDAKARAGLTADAAALLTDMIALQESDGGWRYAMTTDPEDINTRENVIGGSWYILSQHTGLMWAERLVLPEKTVAIHVESWTDLEPNGGVIQRVLPDTITVAISRAIDTEQSITVTLPRGSSAIPSITYGSVLTLRYDNGFGEEWRVLTIQDTIDAQNGAITVIKAVHPVMDLAEMPYLVETADDGTLTYAFGDVGLTPQEYVTSRILPGCPPWTVLGRIDPTITLNVQFSDDTPSSAAQKIVAAVLAQRLACEFQFRRVSRLVYAIDLVSAIGEDATIYELHEGTHLDQLQRSGDATPQTTDVLARGANAGTMQHAAWVVVVVNGTTLKLSDPDSAAALPILVDDQLNGKAVVNPTTGVPSTIIDTDATAQTVSLASTTGFTTGDIVEIRAQASPVLYNHRLALPGRRPKFGAVADTTINPGYNLVPNAFQDAWTGGDTGPADGFTFIPGDVPSIARETGPPVPTYSKNIAHIRNGGYETPLLPWIEKTVATPFVSIKVRVSIVSLRANFLVIDGVFVFGRNELQLSLWNAAETVEIGIIQTSTSTVLGQFIELAVDNIQLPASGRYRLRIAEVGGGIAISGTTEYFVEAFQLTQTAANVDWIRGSGGNKVWHLANYQLSVAGTPPEQYTARVLILPVEASSLSLGGTVRLISETLGIYDEFRIVALTEEPFEDRIESLTLATRRRALTQLLAQAIAA